MVTLQKLPYAKLRKRSLVLFVTDSNTGVGFAHDLYTENKLRMGSCACKTHAWVKRFFNCNQFRRDFILLQRFHPVTLHVCHIHIVKGVFLLKKVPYLNKMN